MTSYLKPSERQATFTAFVSNTSLHTVPQLPRYCTSSRPLDTAVPVDSGGISVSVRRIETFGAVDKARVYSGASLNNMLSFAVILVFSRW